MIKEEFVYPVDDQNFERIKALTAIPVAKLEAALKVIADISPSLDKGESLKRVLSSAMDEEEATGLGSFLFGMRRNIEDYDIDATALIKAVRVGLQKYDESGQVLRAWNSVESILLNLLLENYVVSYAKIRDISRRRSRHVHSISIITSFVPVFTEDRDSVNSGIVENVLYLRTADVNEDEDVFEIELDADDLGRLLRQVENALKKTEVLKRHLTEEDVFTLKGVRRD